MLAIVAAIEIARHQIKIAKQRELDLEIREQIVMLESIATEVQGARSNFTEQVGQTLPTGGAELNSGSLLSPMFYFLFIERWSRA
ncbi:hypothetical protein D3C87_1348880 [compost metagenome]